MARVPATEFKAKCLELMDRVSERHETFVITKRGRPVAKLVPVEPAAKEPLFGRLRGMGVEEVGDITQPVTPAGAWETLEEWLQLNQGQPRRKRKRASGRAARKRR
jgi:prevent-host-death family protein